MQITLKKQEIVKPLEIVKSAADYNYNHLILSYVLIEIKNKTLTLTTTDLEIKIKTIQKINEEKNITFTLCIKDLIEIISALDYEVNINFLITDDKVIISTDKNKFELNTLKEFAFQKLIDSKEIIKNIQINTEQLKNIIKKTKFSIAIDNPQKYLNGLFLELNENKIISATSDGHRLSLAHENYKNTVDSPIKIIIPKNTTDAFLKLLNETNQQDIELNINDNYIVLKNKTTTISSKLISGNYPDYKQIFPESFDNQITIIKEDFIKALKQVQLFTKESKTIKLNFKNSELNITASSEKGNALSSVNIDDFDGEINIHFNVSYLIDTLKTLTSKNIILNIDNNDSDSKVIVLNNTNKDDNCKYLIMAVKV